jgi:hypothetical protein
LENRQHFQIYLSIYISFYLSTLSHTHTLPSLSHSSLSPVSLSGEGALGQSKALPDDVCQKPGLPYPRSPSLLSLSLIPSLSLPFSLPPLSPPPYPPYNGRRGEEAGRSAFVFLCVCVYGLRVGGLWVCVCVCGWVGMYVCVYVYTYVCMYTHTHTHTI